MKTTQVYKIWITPPSFAKSLGWLPLMLAFLAIGLNPCFGQEQADTITLEKTFGGYAFSQNGKRLNMNQLSDALISNPEAYEQYQDAQSSGLAAQLIGSAGGFLVGWPIGTAIGGGEANWNLALIGAGLIAVSIPLNNSYNKRAKQAIDLFNNGPLPDSPSDTEPSKLNVSIQGNGAGFILRF